MEQKIYLAGLHSAGLSQGKLQVIFKKQQNYKEFWDLLSANLLKKYFFSDTQIVSILEKKSKISLEILSKTLKEKHAYILTIHEKQYPKNLKEIPNPPYILYMRGAFSHLPNISVVGSRKMTNYGSRAIEKVISPIAQRFGIVSGGADGCDTKAHNVALASGGKTISVIGTGIDIDYPAKNTLLYKKIVENGGAIVSIFPIGTSPYPYNFPIRNEIVAGLCVGVLAVEAGSKSGTLITTQLAIDMGKDIFAIPGDIFTLGSEGCNNLIKKSSAKLVGNANDILEEYFDNINESIYQQNLPSSQKDFHFDDDDQNNIYQLLLREKLCIDEIIKKIPLPISLLSQKLSHMEVMGFIKKSENGKFIVN